MRRQVRVTWSINQQTYRDQQNTVLGLYIFAALALVAIVLTFAFGFSELAIVPVLVGFICLVRAQHKIRPELTGEHNGLYVLRGLSPEFLNRVQAMIDGESVSVDL